MSLMQSGMIPSVSDVAEAAGVSRATAYRYFPTQGALIQATVAEALGPILQWQSQSDDPAGRVAELIEFSYPRIDRYEATLRAALRLSLDQWAQARVGTVPEAEKIGRGHRVGLLRTALSPLEERLTPAGMNRLAQGLSLVFGSEAFVVLKDIWKLKAREAREVAVWTAHALVEAARADATLQRATPPARRRSRRARGEKESPV